MTLKELRAKKVRLETEARAKKALITDGMAADAVRAIETEHAELLRQIDVVAGEIVAAETRMDDDEERKGKRKGKAKGKGDDDAGDDDAGDDDDAEGKTKRKRKDKAGDDCDEDRVAPGVLTRAEASELVTIDMQARGLQIDLKLSDAIAKGEKPDAMRKRLFEELAKRSADPSRGPLTGTGPGETGLTVLRDETEGRSAAMELALITRILGSRGREGIKFEPKHDELKRWADAHRDQSRQYQGMSFVEIAAECIGYRGHIRSSARAIEIVTRAFQSTSDYPAIFQNVLNKSLLARYELATPTYREIAQERPFNDFRPHPQIRAGDFPLLQPLTETGELKYGSSKDDGENVSVTPYGVIYSISRQMIVNDELGAIDQILGSAGDMVLVFENVTFFVMFNSNPTLTQDTTQVFASGHGNLAGSGAAPSVATIGAARQALRAMKSLSGNYINVPPKIILTGPAQETVADQMVTSITPTLTTSVNPFSGRLRSVSDANISDNSWYLMAEAGRVPCFVYGFLNGATGPRVRTHEPFGVQGVKISVEHDFGCGAIDYRGAYKNPGS